MSSDGENPKNQSSELDEKQNLDSTDTSQDSQDANKSETEENQDKDAGGDAKPKEKSPEPVKTEEKPDVNDNQKEEKNESDEKEEVKKPKDEKIKDDKSEEKTDEDTEGGDASEDAEEDDKKDVPLLDQPLEQTGTRERKKVQRFNEEFSPEPKESSKVDIPSGSGTQLGDIPRIDASISRFKTEDLKLLHRVLFKTPGKTIQIKKNIRKFNGFDFKKDSDAFQKKVQAVQKMEVKQLRSVCEMLDLDKKGSKDDLSDKICEFLLEPKDSGKATSGGRPKRSAAVRANNRGYSSMEDDDESDGNTKRRATRGKGKRSNLKDESSSESDAEFNPSDSEEERPRVAKKRISRNTRKKQESDEEPSELEETPSSDESEENSVIQEPKAKRKRGPAPVAKVQNNKNKKILPKNAKSTPKKPAPASASKNKKQETKKTRKRGKDESEEDERDSENNEGSSSEDEPLVKKNKSPQPPSDEEIKTYVKEILEGANLEEITMKTVCKQVYAHYPDFDLAHKKDFIKATVKSLIST